MYQKYVLILVCLQNGFYFDLLINFLMLFTATTQKNSSDNFFYFYFFIKLITFLVTYCLALCTIMRKKETLEY